jgi:hypothetical protein
MCERLLIVIKWGDPHSYGSFSLEDLYICVEAFGDHETSLGLVIIQRRSGRPPVLGVCVHRCHSPLHQGLVQKQASTGQNRVRGRTFV